MAQSGESTLLRPRVCNTSKVLHVSKNLLIDSEVCLAEKHVSWKRINNIAIGALEAKCFQIYYCFYFLLHFELFLLRLLAMVSAIPV